MIDVNVHLFRWPFRRLTGDDPAGLASRLRSKGVTQAWAGSFEGLFHRDIAAVNARLAEACLRPGAGFLIPFGSVNPKLPDWQEDLERCHQRHRMPGIRLHPNYHGYTLEDPVVSDLLSQSASRGLVVQIALAMEDERTQYPLMRVPPVDPRPLEDLVPRIRDVRLVLLNATRAITRSRDLARAGNVWLDIAMMEGVGGVGHLVRETSPSRVLFGSHYPFYYFEAAALKIREAGLPADQAGRVREANARALLSRA